MKTSEVRKELVGKKVECVDTGVKVSLTISAICHTRI